MKNELPSVDIGMEISLKERSLLDMVICAIDGDDIEAAIRRMERLSDPRAVRRAAMMIGSYASELERTYYMLDMIEKVDDAKMRFGWLLKCLELDMETDIEGESIFKRAEQEIFEIDDPGFAIGAMLALERHGPLALENGPQREHFDPDIADLTHIPGFALA